MFASVTVSLSPVYACPYGSAPGVSPMESMEQSKEEKVDGMLSGHKSCFVDRSA